MVLRESGGSRCLKFHLLHNSGIGLVPTVCKHMYNMHAHAHTHTHTHTSLPEVDYLHQGRLETIVKAAPRGRVGMNEGSIHTLSQRIWVGLCESHVTREELYKVGCLQEFVLPGIDLGSGKKRDIVFCDSREQGTLY